MRDESKIIIVIMSSTYCSHPIYNARGSANRTPLLLSFSFCVSAKRNERIMYSFENFRPLVYGIKLIPLLDPRIWNFWDLRKNVKYWTIYFSLSASKNCFLVQNITAQKGKSFPDSNPWSSPSKKNIKPKRTPCIYYYSYFVE